MAATVVFAVLAALCNALGSVLQRSGARHQPVDDSMSVRLLWRLAHDPAWLGGIVSMLGGFAFQVAALSTGPISLVQPILVAELGFTLLLAALVFGARLHARERTAVAGMIAGIVILLVSLDPGGGSTRGVSGPTWVVGCVVTLAVIGGLVFVANRYRYAHRAAYLGIASGAFFGFLAVLVAGVTGAFPGGLTGVLAAWQTYAVIAAGPTGFLLLQLTLRAGSLVASQPGLTLANPVVGIAWGVAVFGENVRGGGWVVAQLAGFALVGACTVLLARAPSLHGAAGAYEETDGIARASTSGPDSPTDPDEPGEPGERSQPNQ
ncbi:hypothetical protein B1813_18525 [Saccharomonospora piscinae]|uniref:DMT family transporter n=1 Tax=Saccharomonospora piscinae TaxID=687388 RepID=A0A1V8ZY64_SACPI|nr:DMT family transporter [Saccharomonospora piscinae]OQO89845.1 hypothetical protein B1813_18525 [Saccharomonospora piscinae]